MWSWPQRRRKRPPGATPYASLATVEAAQPITPDVEFAISDAVRDAVREFRPMWVQDLLAGDVAGRCSVRTLSSLSFKEDPAACGQLIGWVVSEHRPYQYSDVQWDGLILAHLIQRHGWTREVIGEQ